MPRIKLLGTPVGFRKGRWEVVRTPYRNGKRTMAVCRCDCGTERPVDLYQLMHGLSKDCGRELTVKPGEPFGRWVVESLPSWKSGTARAKCRCACGTVRQVLVAGLLAGLSQSCGCLGAEHRRASARTHGYSGTKLYRIWESMRARCTYPSLGKVYTNYGGRGIKVCPEWAADFAAFRGWALASGYEDGLTIERKNVDGDYEPTNCKWIPAPKQARNRRNTLYLTAFGETKGIADWSEDDRCKVSRTTLRCRVSRYNWPHEEAITAPKTNKYLRARKSV